MKRLVLLLTLLVLANITVAAPKRMNKCEIGLPKEFNTSLLKESTANKVLKTIKANGTLSSTNRYWTAYSDRENNSTYDSPSLNSIKIGKLGFNQEVRIAKIEKGFAYVYTEPNKQIGNLEISSDAVFHGWIPIDNLLIWSSCVTTDDGIYHKALICYNLDEVKSAKTEEEKKQYHGYYNPTKQGTQVPLSTDMNFYFIMKRSNGLALLARQPKLDVATFSTQMLLAWVPETLYVPWNQRSCLEPTWQFEVADAFAKGKKKIYIYDTPEKLAKGNIEEAAAPIPFEQRIPKTVQERQYIYRMPGNMLRFPILDGTTADVYNISTFATLGSNENITDASQEIMDFDNAKLEVVKRKQNINLAIVIDGTQSMEQYYPAVKEAIKKGCEYFSNNYNIKVGIVIYRDYTDDDGLTEYVQLVNPRSAIGRTKINSFLDTGGEYGIKSSSKDITKEEALYYGIDFALNTLDFKEGESNIMLVVGDCGNDKTDLQISQDKLIDKIVAKQVSLMGFQVQNKDDEAYYAFNSQMLRMIRLSLTKTYEGLEKTLDQQKNVKIEIKSKAFGNNYDYEAINVAEKYYFGSYRCADTKTNNGQMETNELTSLMSNTILEYANSVQAIIDDISKTDISSFITSKNTDPGTINLGEAFVLRDLGKDQIDMLKKTKSTITFRGYTNKIMEGKNCFKPIIFLSRDEYGNLLKQMKGVYDVAIEQNYDNREPFINAMKAMVRGFLPGITDSDLNNMTNNDITRLIGGLHESAKMLRAEYSIEKIGSEQHVPRSDYMGIVNDFRTQYTILKNHYDSKTYKYTKDFNGVIYYWIPIDDLP